MKYLAIKDWWKFQHYHKGRGAPWIKMYSALLTDPTFIQFPEAAQAQLMKLWMLASQMGHPLPNNPKLLAGQIGTTGKFHLASIVAAGFVVPCETSDEVLLVSGEQNASKKLDEGSPDDSGHVPASAHSRESGESESGDTLQQQQQQQRAAERHAKVKQVRASLATDADRGAFDTLLGRAGDRHALAVAIESALTDNDPATPVPTIAHMGQAIRDLAANGERPTMRLLRGYLRDVLAEPDRAAGANQPRTTKPTGAIGQRAFDATMDAIRDIA